MPPTSLKNGLYVEKLPPELADITNVENQLIAVNIPLICIKLGKNRHA